LYYVVTLAKQLNFSVVSIGGKDIADGNHKLILSLAHQFWRYDILHFRDRFQTEKETTEEDIIQWANAKVKAINKKTSIKSFDDKSLSNSLFIVDLLFALDRRLVNYSLVLTGANASEKELNAKYVLSIAWKLGIPSFLLWEDIVEVNSRMLLIFIGNLMIWDANRKK